MSIKETKHVDYKLFFAVLFLVVFWMIMISSVSVYSSFRVTNAMAKAWLIDEAYNYFYVVRNITHVVISLITLWFLVKIPYTFFEKNSRHFLFLSVVMLFIVLFIWPSWNGARWWINLPFLPFAIQPTEFLKFSLIIYLAYFFKKYKARLHTFSDGFLPFLMTLSFLVLIIGMQPDFGTILVIVPLSVIMFFVAWANVRYIFWMFVLACILAVSIYSLWDYDKTTGKNLNSLWYITQRIDNFLSNNREAIQNKTINYQTEQALIAIGSGGFTGLGFWQSIQKFWYLPEVQWDFIFSVIVEELWFVGAFILILIFFYIGFRGIMISLSTKDLFAKYVAVWVSTWIMLQAFINIGVNLNIVPLTWITLPFVSYGGSSLLALMFWLAILLNISRYIEPERQNIVSRKKSMFSFLRKLIQ